MGTVALLMAKSSNSTRLFEQGFFGAGAQSVATWVLLACISHWAPEFELSEATTEDLRRLAVIIGGMFGFLFWVVYKSVLIWVGGKFSAVVVRYRWDPAINRAKEMAEQFRKAQIPETVDEAERARLRRLESQWRQYSEKLQTMKAAQSGPAGGADALYNGIPPEPPLE